MRAPPGRHVRVRAVGRAPSHAGPRPGPFGSQAALLPDGSRRPAVRLRDEGPPGGPRLLAGARSGGRAPGPGPALLAAPRHGLLLHRAGSAGAPSGGPRWSRTAAALLVHPRAGAGPAGRADRRAPGSIPRLDGRRGAHPTAQRCAGGAPPFRRHRFIGDRLSPAPQPDAFVPCLHGRLPRKRLRRAPPRTRGGGPLRHRA